MPKLALLTAHGGPIELAEFPLTTPAPGTAALKLRMATDGIGADWVLEVVGVPGVIPDGVGFLNNGGTLIEVGNIGIGRTFELDPSALVYGNKSIRGVMLTRFPFNRLMPKPFHLADVNDAFAAADAGLVPRGALVPR